MPDDTPLARLRTALAAGMPDPMAALDDIERALGGRPSTMPADRRMRALWYTTDRATGLAHEDLKIVDAAMQAIDAYITKRGLFASREELVAEALRLLDMANAMPVEPAPEEPDGYDPEAIHVLRGFERTPRYPVEDGPGAGQIVEIAVRVMIGAERTTVVVRSKDENTRIVAVREKVAAVAGQWVAELVEEALQARDKS